MIKGQIYKIHNPINKNTYIGSTIQAYARKRLFRHRHLATQAGECLRYGCLFDDEVEFSILSEVYVNQASELRELEQVFIKIYENSSDICINKNASYVPEYLKKIKHCEARKKHSKTEGGILNRKWQNHRHMSRKKINKAILAHFSCPGVPGQITNN